MAKLRKRSKKRGGVVVGIMMVVAGVSLLFWNESRSANRLAEALAAEDAAYVASPEDLPSNALADVVMIAADARADGPATDPLFAVEAEVLRLDRVVEMYQWRERREGSGDDARYEYDRVWAEGRIASERFRRRASHENPPAPTIESERFAAPGAALGRMPLGDALLATPHAPDAIAAAAPPAPASVGGLPLIARGDILQTNAAGPVVGDVRVRFRALPMGPYSTLGRLEDGALAPYRNSEGETLDLFEPGLLSLRELVNVERARNTQLTWMIRAGGVFALFIGFLLTLKSLARRIPLIGRLAARLMGPVAGVLAAVVGLTTIAVGWLAVRPITSLVLIGTAIAISALLRWMRADKPEDDLANAAEPPPPPGSPTAG